MSNPEIGALRRRVTLQAPIRTTDAGGGVVVAWSTVAQLWAEIRSLSGTETVLTDSLQGRLTHEITIRRRTDVAPPMRLAMGTRTFVILAVLDRDGPGAYIRIQAEERLQ